MKLYKLYEEVLRENDINIEEIIRKTNENLSKDESKGKFTEWIPIKVAIKYREFNRGGGDREHFEGNIKQLMGSIIENGLHEGIQIAYHPKTDTAMVEEGNHRLKVFELLGIPKIPAYVYVLRSGFDDYQIELGRVKKVRGFLDKERYYDRFDRVYRFPGYPHLKPSDIGIK
tara:strand:+ start:859 stop:1374 length:516 start_codon:yes stop_codon:yes gene_type:complete